MPSYNKWCISLSNYRTTDLNSPITDLLNKEIREKININDLEEKNESFSNGSFNINTFKDLNDNLIIREDTLKHESGKDGKVYYYFFDNIEEAEKIWSFIKKELLTHSVKYKILGKDEIKVD